MIHIQAVGTWVNHVGSTFQEALQKSQHSTNTPIHNWAAAVLKDLQGAFMTLRAETTTPITNWANAAFGDLKQAYEGRFTKKPAAR